MLSADFLLHAFILLLVVIDPFGLAPLFLALTRHQTPVQRRLTAIKSVAISAGILAFFTFAGSWLLHYLGIGMPAFRIAGGALLFLVAIDMLFVRHSGLRSTTQRETEEAAHRVDVSVFPLAIPLIAGPGALTTVMLLTQDHDTPAGSVVVLAITASVLMITLLLFFAAVPVKRLLGETGINVITRLLGILLAALAVQFMLDGLRQGLFAPVQ